jgi:hypothetical protein
VSSHIFGWSCWSISMVLMSLDSMVFWWKKHPNLWNPMLAKWMPRKSWCKSWDPSPKIVKMFQQLNPPSKLMDDYPMWFECFSGWPEAGTQSVWPKQRFPMGEEVPSFRANYVGL